MAEIIPIAAFLLITIAIGSNDTSNALGICIGCGILKFHKAIILFGIVVFLGVYLHGQKVINTVGKDILEINLNILSISYVVSAIIIIFSNLKKMPLSIHQVLIGSLAGTATASEASVDYLKLAEIIISWIISPFIALLLAFLSYLFMEKTLSKLSFVQIEHILRVLLIISGFLIAYNTGANELATVLGPVLYAGLIIENLGFFIGAVFIFLGAFFLSYRVIETIGKGIIALDPYSGFAAQFGAGCTVMLFTLLGMPISTTYCIIGGITGVGLFKGVGTVDIKFVRKILRNWFLAPTAAFIIGLVISSILHSLQTNLVFVIIIA
ncbi:MAG: anion permease [Thermodesulfovibrionales bacterium]|nr:anion permease [Thermodesulfovibrionales bacterium]